MNVQGIQMFGITSQRVADLVREGQKQTMQQIELLKKQMAGTITSDESTRLAMLTGSLLSLQEQTLAQMEADKAVTLVNVEENDEDVYASDEDDEDDYDDGYCGCDDCLADEAADERAEEESDNILEIDDNF